MSNARKPIIIVLALLLGQIGDAHFAMAQTKPGVDSELPAAAQNEEKVVSDLPAELDKEIEYQKLLKVKPSDAKLRFEYGQLLSRRRDKASSEEALKYFRKAVELDTYNIDYNRALFYELMLNKRTTEAAQYYYNAVIPSKTPAPESVENPIITRIKDYNRQLKMVEDKKK